MHRAHAHGPYGQIHTQDTGSGIPLLLCHQAPMSQRQFQKVYPLLHAKGIRAIGFDLPGYGQSDPPDFVPTIEDYAKVLPALLSALELETIHCLGHHTGAQVVTAIALAYPAQISSVVLNGPLPMTADARANGQAYITDKEKGYAPDASGDALMSLFKSRTSFANAQTDWVDATRYGAEALMSLGPF